MKDFEKLIVRFCPGRCGGVWQSAGGVGGLPPSIQTPGTSTHDKLFPVGTQEFASGP